MVFANYACCASCSTFFKDFHLDLSPHNQRAVRGVGWLPGHFIQPQERQHFGSVCQSLSLNVGITEQNDAHIWGIHKGFWTNDGNSAWPNYDEEHCYPLLLSITHTDS